MEPRNRSTKQPTRRKPTPRQASYLAGGGTVIGESSTPAWLPLALIVVAAVVGVVVLTQVVSAVTGGGSSGENTTASGDAPTAGAAATSSGRVSFVAVGDNLPDGVLGEYADAKAGDVGDGAYDYSSLYAPIKPYIESADLAYMKQETHLGGDEIGPRGWPSFNTTDAMANAVVDTGFDLVASASNHSYDWGTYGAVEHSRSVWNTQPVAFTGTATSPEEAAKIPVIERNGITFSLLDYTYGVNGFSQADLPSYAVNFIDEDRIRTDVSRAKEMSDVVMVAMHWGTENQTDPDEDQQRYAQLLADLEVDVVLGSHPHVIGPLAWVEGSTGHRTLVAYSLGNFLSNHEAPAPLNELEGMLSCDFVRNSDGNVTIENATWTPLVNHCEEGAYGVYALHDYTFELAARHAFLDELDDPLAWLRDTSNNVVHATGSDFPIEV